MADTMHQLFLEDSALCSIEVTLSRVSGSNSVLLEKAARWHLSFIRPWLISNYREPMIQKAGFILFRRVFGQSHCASQYLQSKMSGIA